MKRLLMPAAALAAVLLLVLAATSVVTLAQQPGTNVNVLPAYPPNPTNLTDALRGDGYKQRQVEPVVAPSSLNPDVLVSAFGDYRTVNIANDSGLPGGGNAAEGWVGISRSWDHGHTWFGALVPGFPGDPSAVGKASPLFGLAAGSDAGLATGTNGHIYLGALFFNRSHVSNVAVVHYRHVPNLDGGETIQYQGAFIVDKGSMSDQGNFVDKPATAADHPWGTSSASACGNAYIAYTIFTGGTGGSSFNSKVGFSRSKKCGIGWDSPQYLNKTFKSNQGTAIGIDPRNGKLYVVWRTFFPDGLVFATSSDFGATFSNPVVIVQAPNFAPFDQPSITTSQDPAHPAFRTNALPTVAVDASGKVYVAVQERTIPGFSPRIVLRTSPNGGTTWTTGSIVDLGTVLNAHQVMPVLDFAAGQLRLMWYDFRAQNLPLDTSGLYITGLDRQMETYIAQSNLTSVDANQNPVFSPSVSMSQYLLDANLNHIANVGGVSDTNNPHYRVANRPNLPMWNGGVTPFAGDYIYLKTEAPFVANAPGTSPAFRWTTNSNDYQARSSFGVWYDSRDVVFPLPNPTQPPSDFNLPNLFDLPGWQNYSPPGTGTLSCLNSGARDGNVYLSEIKPGVVAGSPALSRQLVDANGAAIERAFPVYVENPNSSAKFFRLTFVPGSGPAMAGSFKQGTEIQGPNFGPIVSQDVQILPLSTTTMSVYVFCSGCTNSTAISPFSVSVQEISGIGGTVQSGGLQTTVLFNNDPTSPFVTNPLLTTQEIHDATVSSPQFANPQFANPQWANQTPNPQFANPQWANPQFANPQYANIAPVNTAPVGDFVWTVQAASNNTSAYSSLTNVATSNVGPNFTYQIIISRTYNTPGADASCNVVPIPQDQIISVIPNPQFANPQFANPQFANPQFANPQFSNATFAAAPPPPGGGASAALQTSAASSSTDDGTIKMPRQPDRVFVILRVYRTSGGPAPAPLDPTTEVPNFLANISQVVFPQAANTGQNTSTGASDKSFSSTALTAAPNSSVFGQQVTLTATVTGFNNTTPGKVDFKDGTTVIAAAVALVGNQATFLTSSLSVGSHSITATYSGDTTFNGSVSPAVTQVVNQANTSTALVSDFNPSVFGQPVTFTATVTAVAPGAGTPTGTATFKDGNTTLGTSNLNVGVATFQTSSLALGTHFITAIYGGDGNFNPSPVSNTVTQSVVFPSWSSGVAQFFDTRTNTGIEGSAASLINGKIYVSHGFRGGDTNLLSIYDIALNTWTHNGNASVARSELAGATDGTKHYAIGGRALTTLADVEVYDPSTGTWSALAPLQTARAGLSAVFANGTLYAIGGRDGDTYGSGTILGSVEKYNAGSWTYVAPLPTPLSDIYATVAFNGKIYVFGGTNSPTGASNAVQIYDPVSDFWTAGAAMPTPRGAAMAAVLGNRIAVFGGYDGGAVGNLAVTEVYDPGTDTWSSGPALTTAASEMAAGVVSDGSRAFAIGSGIFGVSGTIVQELGYVPPAQIQ